MKDLGKATYLIGKTLTPAEIQVIEDRGRRAYREELLRDPALLAALLEDAGAVKLIDEGV